MKIRNRNTILDIPTDESGSIQTNNTDIFVTGGTFLSNTITFRNNNGGTFDVPGITLSGASIGFVTDEDDRDATYPSPVDRFQVFNLRTNFIETYRTDYGLWLNNGMVVAIEDTSVEDVDIRHIVYTTTTGRTISGFEYPLVAYPVDSTSRGLAIGVVVQIGDTISGTSSYISVAQLGQYYVNHNATITIGNPVYARTDGSGLADDGTFAQSGTIGKAIQNSGSNPNYSASTLVMLNPDGR